jgi:hypothetical protein
MLVYLGQNSACVSIRDWKACLECICHIKGFTKLAVSHRYFMPLLRMKM